ncbi:MAG: hypothetical protein M0035_10095 [Actinomycetota bacterium]|jgi:hypothetical protein|nr:hypothetical protein [Actinomycetota bacterium]
MSQVELPLPGGIVEVLTGSGSGLVERVGKYRGEVELPVLFEPLGLVELFEQGEHLQAWSPRRRDEEARAKATLYELLAMEAGSMREEATREHHLLYSEDREVGADDLAQPRSVDAGGFLDHEERHLARLVEAYSAGLSRRHRHMHLLVGLGVLFLAGFIVGLSFVMGDTTPIDTVANIVLSACGGALLAAAELRLLSRDDKASQMRRSIEEARVVIVADAGRVHLGLLVKNRGKAGW